MVCKEWINNYEEFRKWALSSGYNSLLTIDRIDNNGNYEPSNCRFSTPQEQSFNRRTPKNNTGYVGIRETKFRTFLARVSFSGETIFCKTYKTIEEAIIMRNAFIDENGLPNEKNIT